MLDAKEVYSKYANNNLLSFAIKNEKIDLADQVISNSDNIDVRAALSEVLARYPDSDAKGERIATLLETGGLKYEDRKIIESYLSDTQDSVETKSKTSIAALNQGLSINLDLLLDRVLRIADPETVTATLSAFCKSKIGDEDVFKILSFACLYWVWCRSSCDCRKLLCRILAIDSDFCRSGLWRVYVVDK